MCCLIFKLLENFPPFFYWLLLVSNSFSLSSENIFCMIFYPFKLVKGYFIILLSIIQFILVSVTCEFEKDVCVCSSVV